MGFRSKAEKFSALVSKEGGNERGKWICDTGALDCFWGLSYDPTLWVMRSVEMVKLQLDESLKVVIKFTAQCLKGLLICKLKLKLYCISAGAFRNLK